MVDLSADRRRIATAHGFAVADAVPTSAARDSRYELIVGCTGGTSFTWENRGILVDTALLASGSSAAVELDRARLVERADADPCDEFEVLNDRNADAATIHADVRFRHGRDQQFIVLSAGSR